MRQTAGNSLYHHFQMPLLEDIAALMGTLVFLVLTQHEFGIINRERKKQFDLSSVCFKPLNLITV